MSILVGWMIAGGIVRYVFNILLGRNRLYLEVMGGGQ